MPPIIPTNTAHNVQNTAQARRPQTKSGSEPDAKKPRVTQTSLMSDATPSDRIKKLSLKISNTSTLDLPSLIRIQNALTAQSVIALQDNQFVLEPNLNETQITSEIKKGYDAACSDFGDFISNNTQLSKETQQEIAVQLQHNHPLIEYGEKMANYGHTRRAGI